MNQNSLKTRLKIAKTKIAERNLYKDKEPPSSIGTAFKLSTELVSAVVIGTIIGFILDKTFGTKPWLILIFFFYRCGCRYFKCIQICKKYAKVDLKDYGNKSNAPVRSL